jgi:hypothetical protein
VYHEDNGIHIFQDLMDEQEGPVRLRLEYREESFEVNMLLSAQLSAVILYGLYHPKICALRRLFVDANCFDPEWLKRQFGERA